MTGTSPNTAQTASPAARGKTSHTLAAQAGAAAAQANTRLGTRDYITIGVYTVLYFILIAIGAGLTHAVPIGLPLMGFMCGILGGVPYMLVLMKSRRFGAVTIMGVLLALTMGVIHGNYYTVITALIAAVAADLIARAGQYRNLTLCWLSAGIFNLWNLGMFLPFYIGRSGYLAGLASKRGAGYANELAGLFPWWVLPVLLVIGVAGGILGALIAKVMMRKHFQRAGLV
jgi:energy-coupling factor transport system substrate-specific component